MEKTPSGKVVCLNRARGFQKGGENVEDDETSALPVTKKIEENSGKTRNLFENIFSFAYHNYRRVFMV